MPNLCDNTLWVVGKPAEVKKFLEASKNPNYGKKAKKADYDGKFRKDNREWRIFERNFPCPQELVDTPSAFYGDKEKQAEQEKIERANVAKYGAKSWYDWCLKHWGTKWGDYDTYLDRQDKNGATFSFTTAWSPGSEGLQKISALWPELAFVNAYEEPGCDFIGCDVFYRGKVVHSGSGGFPEGPDDWDDDEATERHYEEVNEIREEWTKKAVAKLTKKSAFHGKKLKAMVRP